MASSIRLSDQPSRPSSRTCSFFSSPRTLPIPEVDHDPLAFVNISHQLTLVAAFQVSISGRCWVSPEAPRPRAFRAQLAEKLELARWAYRELSADGHFELVDEPQLSVVAFRLRGPADEADQAVVASVAAPNGQDFARGGQGCLLISSSHLMILGILVTGGPSTCRLSPLGSWGLVYRWVAGTDLADG